MNGLTRRTTTNRTRRRGALALLAFGAVAALTGCSAGGGNAADGEFGFPQVEQEAGSTITVWVDAERSSAVDAFKAAHPDIAVKAESYDGSANGSNSFRTKMQLFDRSGSGWPDVVFSTQNNDASWASQTTNGKQAFAAKLDGGLVADDVISDFADGALDPCTVDGSVYCLRNDLAQVVLWYNAKLMDQFGYDVPTTWEEYQELGEKVAEEHPGYIIGTAGDAWTPEVYFWASKCGANGVTSASDVTVDATSDECARAATMLDDLRENGTVPAVSVFTPQFVSEYAGKVLMAPGPAWYSGAVFQSPDSLALPAGELGVAAPLAWEGEEPVTGNVGGGTWFVSSHSKNLEAATEFAQFVTTSDDYQVETSPGYPAYTPAAENWLAKQEASGYFATPLAPVTQAATTIWDGWGSGSFSQEAIWAKTVTPAVAGGKTLEELLPTWQKAIEDQARVNGYTVR